MFNKAYRIVSAKICFFIFFSKMMLSATPIFIDNVDQGTILRIVMQLEIENTKNGSNTNNEDLHEHGVKIFKPDAVDFLAFNPTVESQSKNNTYLRNEKSIISYHPAVPTPPPNC